MDARTALGLIAVVCLAFANGANDISKSIATLVGSGESDYKKAVVVTSLGGRRRRCARLGVGRQDDLALHQGDALPQVQLNQAFALAILAGAVGWVLLSTRVGMPVSTTHAIVGATLLTGLYAFGFDQVLWGSVWRKVARASPAVAGHRLRRRLAPLPRTELALPRELLPQLSLGSLG